MEYNQDFIVVWGAKLSLKSVLHAFIQVECINVIGMSVVIHISARHMTEILS